MDNIAVNIPVPEKHGIPGGQKFRVDELNATLGMLRVVDAEIDSSAHVTPDPIPLSKGRGEQIRWWNNTEVEVTVVFVDSPFQWKNLTIVPGGSETSGPIIVNPAREFKYTVRVGSVVNDPRVIINH
jgi:hypothetical protein